MWSVRSEARTGYLGSQVVAVPLEEGDWQWQPAADLEAGVRALAAAARQRARRPRLSLWLAGSLARPFIVPAVPGLRSWTEALRLAQALAPDETGLAGPCEVWLDAAGPGEPTLGVAIDEAMKETVRRILAEEGVALASMRPWWSKALAQALQARAGLSRLVIAEPESLVVLAGSAAGFTAAAVCAPLPAPDRATAWLQRTALSLGLDGPGMRAALSQDTHAADATLEDWT